MRRPGMPFRCFPLRYHDIAVVPMARRPSERKCERKEKENLPRIIPPANHSTLPENG
jgi:hypothetical protein